MDKAEKKMLWVRFLLGKGIIYYLHFFALLARQSAVLGSTTQHIIHQEFGGE